MQRYAPCGSSARPSVSALPDHGNAQGWAFLEGRAALSKSAVVRGARGDNRDSCPEAEPG